MTTIYGLYDELDNIRYVGKTEFSLDIRYKQHLDYARLNYCENSHCHYWIRSMFKHNLNPVIKELVVVNGPGNLEETFYILLFKFLGAKLTNLTDGGDGTKGWKPSKENLKNMSKASKRQWTKRIKKGYTVSKEHIKKVKETRIKHNNYLTTAKKIVESRRQNGTLKQTPESIAKMIETKRLNKLLKQNKAFRLYRENSKEG